jgi:hypothetical protein
VLYCTVNFLPIFDMQYITPQDKWDQWIAQFNGVREITRQPPRPFEKDPQSGQPRAPEATQGQNATIQGEVVPENPGAAAPWQAYSAEAPQAEPEPRTAPPEAPVAAPAPPAPVAVAPPPVSAPPPPSTPPSPASMPHQGRVPPPPPGPPATNGGPPMATPEPVAAAPAPPPAAPTQPLLPPAPGAVPAAAGNPKLPF